MSDSASLWGGVLCGGWGSAASCGLRIFVCRIVVFFFQAEDGIRDDLVTGVQTCALPISALRRCCTIGRKANDESPALSEWLAMVQASQKLADGGALLRVASATSSITGQCWPCSGLRRLGTPFHGIGQRAPCGSANARCCPIEKDAPRGTAASRQSASPASVSDPL